MLLQLRYNYLSGIETVRSGKAIQKSRAVPTASYDIASEADSLTHPHYTIPRRRF